MQWQTRTPELTIQVSSREAELYRRGDPTSAYSSVRWPRLLGRGRHGEFPLVVTREHFRQLGFTVLASEPGLPDGAGFILVSYPGKRRDRHSAYVRMEAIFGQDKLTELNRRTDQAKRFRTGNASGGDPDLFVFRGANRFFVEVKWRDKITSKQALTFPIIEEICGVEIKLARLTVSRVLPSGDAA